MYIFFFDYYLFLYLHQFQRMGSNNALVEFSCTYPTQALTFLLTLPGSLLPTPLPDGNKWRVTSTVTHVVKPGETCHIDLGVQAVVPEDHAVFFIPHPVYATRRLNSDTIAHYTGTSPTIIVSFTNNHTNNRVIRANATIGDFEFYKIEFVAVHDPRVDADEMLGLSQ
jgi:hypothetical protein